MIEMTASVMTTGVAHMRGLREELEAEPDHPVGADLVEDADEQHRGRGTGLGRGIRQPRVHRPHRRLDGEGDEEPDEHPAQRRRRRVEVAGEAGDEEAVVTTGARDVDPDDGHEHDQPAREGEQEELHRGVLPAWAAEQPDEEVHRDQHRLEEDVEQEHVGGGEDADDERLEHQHQREVALLAAGALVADVVPRGEQADRGEDGRHHDERQRDAVDTEGVGDPELRDPRVHLGELELLDGVGVEPHPREHRQHQRHEREAQGHRLRVTRRAPGQHGDDDGAEQRHHHHQGEQGQGVHWITHRAPRTVTTPVSIVRAYDRT